jgi:hypothetical protein
MQRQNRKQNGSAFPASKSRQVTDFAGHFARTNVSKVAKLHLDIKDDNAE